MRQLVSFVIIMMSVAGMVLVLVTSKIYVDLAITDRETALAETIELKTQDLMQDLERHSRDLGITIQLPALFREHVARRNIDAIIKHLDIQFHQYFVTADVIKLEKLYIYDEYLALIAESSEGAKDIQAGDEVCPGLIVRAKRRHGPRRLQPIAEICTYHNMPYHGMAVPIGGLKISGYIVVISNPIYNLKQLETDLGLPIRLSLPQGELIYQADNWPNAGERDTLLIAQYLLRSNIFEPALEISVAHNGQALTTELRSTQIVVAATTLGIMLLVMIAAFMMFQALWFQPLQKLKHYLHAIQQDRSRLGESLEIVGNQEISEIAQYIGALGKEYTALHHSIDQLTYTDALTELPNRALFTDRLQQNIFLCERNKSSFALMMMDIDRFKEINDVLGSEIGDKLLQQVSQRLQQILRKSDTLARLTDRSAARFASDEFAAILPATGDEQNAITVAQKIQRAMDHAYTIEGQTVNIELSIGIAIYPDHGNEPQSLLQRADIAMYQAKHNHQGFALYDSSHDNHSLSQLTMISDLRRAIESDGLSLVFQPKVAMNTSQLVGIEALVRWDHPERGTIPLNSFLPLAEHTGLIKPLTKWVVRQTAIACDHLHHLGFPIHATVNISARNLLDASLSETVLSILETTGLDGRWLYLELTESAVMSDSTRALRTLEKLHAAGIHLVIDDFGTGHSSLTTLKKLPVDEIKIDRSFVLEMKEHNNDTVIVRSTIDLAHNMGMRVTAEGVDTEEVWHLLKLLGCDMAQGNHICPAITLTELQSWIHNWDWGCAAAPDHDAHHDATQHHSTDQEAESS